MMTEAMAGLMDLMTVGTEQGTEGRDVTQPS